MAFIDDQMAVVGNDIGNFSLAHQALDERDIDDACRFSFPATNNADLLRVHVQKGFVDVPPID